MDLKESTIKGGVLIVHKVHEGKHQYEVGNVLKYKIAVGQHMFVRRGDKLVQINSVDLQDLTPDELAEMLAKGNPLLKVHKVSKMKEPIELPPMDEETLHPVSKENTILSFSMEMKREEEEEGNNLGEEGGWGDGETEEDDCQVDNVENGEMKDLLVVSMKNPSISVVAGRGCDTESPCQGCHGIGCSFNDVVMVSESSTVTLVARGGSSFKQTKHLDASVEHIATNQYLRGLCSQKTIYASPNPERITIYYYKSTFIDRTFRGMPVVLNFTDSNCFLRCCKDGGRVFLQVEMCEKRRLKQIPKNDESTLSFVFYMKSDVSKQTKFESVLHRGWFIQILNTDSQTVRMETLDGPTDEHSFLFIIQQ